MENKGGCQRQLLKKFKKSFMGFLFAGLALMIPAIVFAEGAPEWCAQAWEKKGECPTDLCKMNCLGGMNYAGCPLECVPKSCVEIDAGHCPDRCQVIKGCNDNKGFCYYRMEEESGKKCGEPAYAGDLDCCAGLVKRCGAEFLDGSCDMLGKNSAYGVPICIPCGNGICNQFENRCNCPEDCGQGS